MEKEALWRRAILLPGSTLQDAIQKLNEVAIKIVLVCNSDGSLQGTISDGDIRRGLLRGLNLQSPLNEVTRRDPLVVPEGMSRELVFQLMAANKVQQIPVVDQNGCPIGMHLWDELTTPIERPNTIIIMAGGRGTRLRPYTENCPKPMLSVAGKPMLEHIIQRASLEGFRKFVLSVHYLGHMIEDHFGNGERFGVHIEYIREDVPLGTAGALSLIAPIPDQPFIVTNGDVITDIHYGELLDFHIRHDAVATMAVRQHEWQNPFGVVRMRGVEIVGFQEKPVSISHINAGVYALSSNALNSLNTGENCDMPTLFERLANRGSRTIAYPMHELWLDVGRPDDLAKANETIN